MTPFDIEFSTDAEENTAVMMGITWQQRFCIGLQQANIVMQMFNLDVWNPTFGMSQKLSGELENYIVHTIQLISSSPHNQKDLQIMGKLKEDAAKGRSAATVAKQFRGSRKNVRQPQGQKQFQSWKNCKTRRNK